MVNSKETQIEILKFILSRTRGAEKKLEMLSKQLQLVMDKMSHPIDGISYKPTIGGGGGVNDGAADIPIRADEIERKIQHQRDVLARCILQGSAILDELDAKSDERAILSAYYISGQKYEEIAAHFDWDMSTIWRKMRIGYDRLIQIPRIQDMLAEAEEEWRKSL